MLKLVTTSKQWIENTKCNTVKDRVSSRLEDYYNKKNDA
jgi:hypothetical protein